MHILETYSLLSGAKINKCFIEETPISLPYKDYIVFHPECQKAPARQYKKWNEVLELMKNDSAITSNILQIGSITDKKYDIDTSFLGKITANELAYIMRQATLFLGYDSFPMHMASHYDKKIVCLFSYYANNSRPYFSSKNNITLLEPNFSKYKPSLLYIDEHDLINTIPPILIYEEIKKYYDSKSN